MSQTFTHDLSQSLSSDYAIHEISVVSSAPGYDDSDAVTEMYYIGATIAIASGVISIVDVIQGVTSFKLYVDGVLIDTVAYDYSSGWGIDMSDYESQLDDGKHEVRLAAVGTGIADNRSNAVYAYVGTLPIYGVSGLYNSNRALTRTDDAVGMDFVINSSSGAIDSDFDDVFPWNQAEVVDLDAGKFLRLPDMFFRVGTDANGKITDIAVSGMPSGSGNWYEVKGFDVACYGASVSGSALRSWSGQTRASNQTRASFRSKAAATGTGYYQYDFYHHTVLQFLWLIEWATKDSASIMTGRISGSGTSGGSSARPTGGTDNVATPSGFETAYAQMRWHYIEDFIGNLREFYDGIINTSPGSPSYITTDPTKFSDSDTTNMSALSFNNANTNNGNCIAALGWDSDHPFFAVPIEVVNNGNFNTYFCDGYYPSAGYPVVFGGAGYIYANASNGVFYVNTNSASYSYANLGARLLHSS